MVFTDIIKLRDELSEIAFNNNAFCTTAANEVNDITDNINEASCQLDGLSYNYSSNGLIVKDDQNVVIKTIPQDEISDHLADVVPGTSARISDVFSTFSNSGDLYSTLAMITQKYSYSNRISLTDLNAMIDGVNSQSSLNYDVSSLKQQLLSCSNNDGYVTNKAWLVSLRYWIKECEDEANSQSPELDNTKPNVLSGLYSIISSVLQTTMSAIFTAIGAVFGAIGLLVATAFSKIFDLIKTGVSESGSINADSCNLFAKGVCISREETYSGATSELEPYVANDYRINYSDLDSCGFFFWKGSADNKVRMNAYLCPHHSPENTLTAIDRGTSSVNWDGIGLVRTKESWSYVFDPSMTSDQEQLCASDIGYYSACLCVSELVRWLRSTPRYMYDGSTKEAQRVKLNITPGQSFSLPDNRFLRAICVGMLILYGLKQNSNIYQIISRSDVIDTANYLASAAWDLRDNYTNMNIVTFNPTNVWNGTHMWVIQNPLITSNYANSETSARLNGVWMEYSYDEINHDIIVLAWGWHFYMDEAPVVANSLPTEFCAEFAALSSEAVRGILIISALVAIASSVVTLKVSKAMRLKKIKKQTLRSDKIADAKAKYEDYRDPNREGGPKTPEEINSALTEYTQEVDRFNRMGKIFNWGSYDAANGWINLPDSGTSDATTMSGIIDMFQGQRNANTTQLNSLGAEIITTSEYSLKEIAEKIDHLIYLISGEQ